jgi:protein SCO1/2
MSVISRRDWLGGAGAAGLAGLGAAVLLPAAAGNAPPPRGRGFREAYFPNLELRNQCDEVVRFYDDCLKGKRVLVQFTYLSCEGKCPLITANLVQAQRLLGERAGRDVFFVSISLKPELDTPAALRQHAALHGVGPGWTFLTGRPADIELLRRRFGMVDPDPELDADPSNHTGMVRIGNVPYERWLGCPGQAPPAWIVRSILSI